MFLGHETTTAMIASSLVTLLSHPEQLQKLKQYPNLLGSAIDECLRYVGAAGSTSRVTVQDLELPKSGMKLKKGQPLLLEILASSHDPNVFENPETFDITRTTKTLAFGRGVHVCVGKPLALLELRVALRSLLKKFPNMKLPPNFKPEWTGNKTIHGLKNPTILLK